MENCAVAVCRSSEHLTAIVDKETVTARIVAHCSQISHLPIPPDKCMMCPVRQLGVADYLACIIDPEPITVVAAERSYISQ